MFRRIFNRLEQKVTQVSGTSYRPALFSFEHFLTGSARIYGTAVRFYRFLHETGFLKRKKLPCPVVSIGNIVAGGTGKTPMAVFMAGLLTEMGYRPVVVSRGYKGSYKGAAVVVGDGTTVFLDAASAGDEPYMMASLKLCPVVVGRDRFSAGMAAVNAFQPDVLILDDAFQHIRLERDLNLLLLDYSAPLGNGRLLPAGRLREPVPPGLARADAVVFTRCPIVPGSSPGSPGAERLKHSIFCPWFTSFHLPYLAAFLTHQGKYCPEKKELRELGGRKALLFSGLAGNAAFYDSVKESGINILGHLEFKDHYRYKKADMLQINRTAKEKGADIILTTHKDWVKLDSFSGWTTDIGVVGIRIQLENATLFRAFISDFMSDLIPVKPGKEDPVVK